MKGDVGVPFPLQHSVDSLCSFLIPHIFHSTVDSKYTVPMCLSSPHIVALYNVGEKRRKTQRSREYFWYGIVSTCEWLDNLAMSNIIVNSFYSRIRDNPIDAQSFSSNRLFYFPSKIGKITWPVWKYPLFATFSRLVACHFGTLRNKYCTLPIWRWAGGVWWTSAQLKLISVCSWSLTYFCAPSR